MVRSPVFLPGVLVDLRLAARGQVAGSAPLTFDGVYSLYVDSSFEG